jgi:Protein of unknown function (DUF3311)
MLWSSMDRTAEAPTNARRTNKWWLLPLLLPYAALLFPQIYARQTPTLLGFPFFYWYQFVWVIVTSAILGAVYQKTKT